MPQIKALTKLGRKDEADALIARIKELQVQGSETLLECKEAVKTFMESLDLPYGSKEKKRTMDSMLKFGERVLHMNSKTQAKVARKDAKKAKTLIDDDVERLWAALGSDRQVV